MRDTYICPVSLSYCCLIISESKYKVISPDKCIWSASHYLQCADAQPTFVSVRYMVCQFTFVQCLSNTTIWPITLESTATSTLRRSNNLNKVLCVCEHVALDATRGGSEHCQIWLELFSFLKNRLQWF